MTAMADEIGLFEAIHTQRALRYIKAEPVPDALIRKVLEAGTRAPNGGNQGETRTAARNDAAAEHLAEHLHEVPVLILCCVQHDGSPSDIQRGASIYPAVQNMLLAARGLGLASVLTTRPRRGFEREIKAKLGIPDNVDTAALLPLGYPAERNRYGPTNRRPVEEVTFDEAWGKPWHA
jgi:nitroreductase